MTELHSPQSELQHHPPLRVNYSTILREMCSTTTNYTGPGHTEHVRIAITSHEPLVHVHNENYSDPIIQIGMHVAQDTFRFVDCIIYISSNSLLVKYINVARHSISRKFVRPAQCTPPRPSSHFGKLDPSYIHTWAPSNFPFWFRRVLDEPHHASAKPNEDKWFMFSWEGLDSSVKHVVVELSSPTQQCATVTVRASSCTVHKENIQVSRVHIIGYNR